MVPGSVAKLLFFLQHVDYVMGIDNDGSCKNVIQYSYTFINENHGTSISSLLGLNGRGGRGLGNIATYNHNLYYLFAYNVHVLLLFY